jgi:hypothetical protein
MTDLQSDVTTARVKVTMRELGPSRILRHVTDQMDAVNDVFDYIASAAGPGLGGLVWVGTGAIPGEPVTTRTRGYDPEVESLSLKSPLVLVLTVSYGVALTAMRIFNRWQDLRTKRARADTEVLQEQHKQDVIADLRAQLRATVDREIPTQFSELPSIAALIDDVTARAADGFDHIAAIKMVEPGEA